VGGDFRKPKEAAVNVLRTRDGGRTWTPVARSRPAGVRYGVAVVPGTPGPALIAVGPSGWGYSPDGGATWQAADTTGYNTVDAGGPGRIWLAGREGRIARIRRLGR
jgi:photosystem II stability/assembly factor-like uncharacterized protein